MHIPLEVNAKIFFEHRPVGNLGGFVGPKLMGHLKDLTGNFTVGLCTLAASLLVTGMLVLLVGTGLVLWRATRFN